MATKAVSSTIAQVKRHLSMTFVYDAKLFAILKELGSVTVTRATEVEFDNQTGEWVATHIESGEVIGRGEDRDQLIKDEVSWLENRL